MNNLIAVLVAISLGGLAIAYSFARYTRMNSLVESWAQSGGYRIVSCERTLFSRGPYWIKSQSQTIFKVVVEDRSGQKRNAWLRCGGPFWSDNVDVEWE